MQWKPIIERKNRNIGVDGPHDDCDAGISPRKDELKYFALIQQVWMNHHPPDHQKNLQDAHKKS